MNTHSHGPINSPWVLVDDLIVDQTADLLERLVGWLDGPDAEAATRCARTLSLGETDDPETILNRPGTVGGLCQATAGSL